MRLTAVLFDMDGVLWKSGPVHSQAYRDVLSPLGITSWSYKDLAGQRTRDVIAELSKGLGLSEAQVRNLAEAKSARALEGLRDLNPVTPLALDVVERLSLRFPLALVTSGSPSSADLFLRRNEAASLFQAVVTGPEVSRAKPAPDLFLAAAARLSVPPEECLVVEDSIAGIQSAKAAGCRAIAFSGALSEFDTPASGEYLAAGAERVLRGLEDLLPLTGCNDRRSWGAQEFPSVSSYSEPWTTIIPAAGRGSRLGFDLPKVLFPLAGRPILEWLLELFEPRSAHIVVVASPSGRDPIQKYLESRGSGHVPYSIALQEQPLGMKDAVECALPYVQTPNTMIVWGDQVALRHETIDSAMTLHVSAGALATVPTLWREKPYIHFERAADGKLTSILQAREGDLMPPEGESDTGLFLFRSIALRRLLAQAEREGQMRGRSTGELNFLPLLPFADSIPGNVITARIVTKEESVGVNTREEAAALARVLTR